MASISSSSHRTSHVTPRERVLTANIYISTLQLIAALLLTLMLLWHISTVTLIENYQMPPWWIKRFMAELASGWRLAVWTVVVVLVPIDCLHALLCLDWWCVLLHGRGVGDEKGDGRVGGCGMSSDEKTHEDTDDRRRETHGGKTHTSAISHLSPRTPSLSATEEPSTSSTLPHTYHPLRHPPLLPQTQNTLLSILDITILAVLASHITSYFLSLPRYLAHCEGPDVKSAPDVEFGEARVPLSARDRCIGLNVDIHIAGGFAVFMAIVLGMLHCAALGVRGWERVKLGGEGVLGRASVEDGVMGMWGCECDTVVAELDAVGMARPDSTVQCTTLRDVGFRQPNSAALGMQSWERVQLGEDGVLGRASVEDAVTANCGRGCHTALPNLEAADPMSRPHSTVCSKQRDAVSRQPHPTASLTTPPRGPASSSTDERNTGVGVADSNAGHK